MKKRLILTAGGTGGHLFPAQALAHDLIDRLDVEILFVGGGLSQNRYFDRSAFAFKEINVGTFRSPLSLLKGGAKIGKGVWQSQKILRSFSPDLVIGFGSFYTLPLLMAATWRRIPFILHEQNAVCGRVNQLFSPLAKRTTSSFSNVGSKKNRQQVAFPLRKQEQGQSDPWDYFGLDPKEPTLLVFGGSQGARHLNTLVMEMELFSCQVLHFAGNDQECTRVKEHYKKIGRKGCVKSFEPRMDLAFKIADMAIVRAGAATIAELIDAAVPAIVVPFPFATNQHQEKNGEHFSQVVGGGVMVRESELDNLKLSNLAHVFFHTGLEEKKCNIQKYRKTHKMPSLTTVIEEIIRDA